MRAMMKAVAEKAFPKQVKALIERQDSRADLQGYHLPVRLICGREDKLTPLAFHEEMASWNAKDGILGFQLHEYPLDQLGR